MRLLFRLQKENIHIVLEKDGMEWDVVILDDLRSLSQTLLPAVDDLLRRHHLSVEALTSIEMTSDIAPVFTSYRIVEATVKSLKANIYHKL